MKREASIELFRCLCMFGVCLLHALDQGGYADPHRGLDNLMTPSVVGFLFISGWFGVKLKMKSVLKLVGIGLYCGATLALVYDCVYLGKMDVVFLIKQAWMYCRYSWFLWCYLAMMILAPLFEPLFDSRDGVRNKETLRKIIPVLVLVFGWSYAATKIPILKNFTPNVGGFGGFGVLTFVGIYLAARTCRYYELDQWVKTKWLWLSAALSGTACWFNFMHYHSPFALIFAGSMFLLFKRLPIKNKLLSSTILFLAPSMFSVYLLHNSTMGMAWMQSVEDKLIATAAWNYYLVCFLVACGFFFGGLILDFPRRCLMYKRVHPSVAGMQSLADQVTAAVRK